MSCLAFIDAHDNLMVQRSRLRPPQVQEDGSVRAELWKEGEFWSQWQPRFFILTKSQLQVFAESRHADQGQPILSTHNLAGAVLRNTRTIRRDRFAFRVDIAQTSTLRGVKLILSGSCQKDTDSWIESCRATDMTVTYAPENATQRRAAESWIFVSQRNRLSVAAAVGQPADSRPQTLRCSTGGVSARPPQASGRFSMCGIIPPLGQPPEPDLQPDAVTGIPSGGPEIERGDSAMIKDFSFQLVSVPLDSFDVSGVTCPCR